jgi:multicomponent Na+:H+ antiporter subunit F
MPIVLAASAAALAAAATLVVLRLVLCRSTADRVVALDLLMVYLLGGVTLATASSRGGDYLNLMLVIAVVGFLSTAVAASAIEGGEDARE